MSTSFCAIRRARGRRARSGSSERRSSTGASHDRPAVRLLERTARGQVTREVEWARVVRERMHGLRELAKRLSLRWIGLHALTIARASARVVAASVKPDYPPTGSCELGSAGASNGRWP